MRSQDAAQARNEPPRTRSRARRRVRAERDSLARVLGLIRSGSAGTRQELERTSGLGRAVVADRLTTLIAKGLVEEGDLAASTGGRAPRQVRFKGTAGHLLVGSLGSTTFSVGLADLSGRLLVEHHEAGDVTMGAANTLDRLDALFSWMLQEHPAGRDVWGIGLGVPGPVELTGGRLSSPPVLHLVPGWQDFPVREHLSQRFGVPVWVDSEIHLMALGELRAGRGVGRDDLLFLKVGTGIGAGLCANGALHRGAHGYAGDIGHVVVAEESDVTCRCGNSGCLEALAGGAAIAREGQEAAADGRSSYLASLAASGRSITAADVGMAAHRGDPFSIALLSHCGSLVGATLATLVNAYDPSLVVIGGGVAQAGEILIAAIRESLYRHSRSLATQDLHIVRSELGKTAGLTGAALAVVDELFSLDYLRTWLDHGSPNFVAPTGAATLPPGERKESARTAQDHAPRPDTLAAPAASASGRDEA